MTTTTRKTTESNKSGLPADSCVFCRIATGTEPATVVREWEDAIAFSPRHPVTRLSERKPDEPGAESC